MDDIFRQMIQGYFDGFDMYEITSSSLQEDVTLFKEKLTGFAESNQDINTFHQRLAESGLQEEYSGLITKVAMAAMASEAMDSDATVSASKAASSASESEGPGEDSGSHIVFPTVSEFVEQYRISYEEVKKSGYRKRGEAAYEAIFNVANRTDDMVEAQIIMEEERLLWNIVKDDSLDIFEMLLDAMDPLDIAVNYTTVAQINAYINSDSDEELTYNLEVSEHEKHVRINHFLLKKILISQIALMLTKYCKCKTTIYEWKKDILVKAALREMIRLRKALKRSLSFIADELGLSFYDLFNDEGIKINMILPANADEFGRIKTALNPQNLDVFEDIIVNEIMRDEVSVKDILSKVPEQALWFDLDDIAKDSYEKSAMEKAKALNSDLIYYSYSPVNM